MGAVPDRWLSVVLRARRSTANGVHAVRVALRSARLGDWATVRASLRAALDDPGLGQPGLRVYYRRLMQRTRRAAPTVRFNRRLFAAVADPDRTIWIDPRQVTRRATYGHNLYPGEILPGDWDLRTTDLKDTHTYRSIVQHFRDGIPWEETDYFRDKRGAFARGGTVGGAGSLDELTHYYDTHVRRVYESIARDGFLARNIPHVHVGCDGQIIMGGTGIRRLAMAIVAGVTRMPVYVHARHLSWQVVRERIASDASRGTNDAPYHGAHPDVQDLLGAAPAPTAVDDVYGVAERIPSMGGTRIGADLRALARSAPPGTAVVEVGSWLGAGTAQLALGISERAQTADVRLHCYDRWRASRMEVQKANRWGLRLAVGEDTLPLVRETMATFGVPAEFHQGDVREAGWNGEPISVYVDDASKMPDLFIHALLTFGRSWIPGVTVIALMDYDIWQATGSAEHHCQKSFIESNADSFTRLPCRGHALFRYTAPVDWRKVTVEGLTRTLRQREKEVAAIKSSTSWRLTAPLRWCGDITRARFIRQR